MPEFHKHSPALTSYFSLQKLLLPTTKPLPTVVTIVIATSLVVRPGVTRSARSGSRSDWTGMCVSRCRDISRRRLNQHEVPPGIMIAFMATLYRRRTAVAEPWSRRVAAAVRGGKHRGVPRRSVNRSTRRGVMPIGSGRVSDQAAEWGRECLHPWSRFSCQVRFYWLRPVRSDVRARHQSS